MNSSVFPSQVQNFILDRIQSVEQLEVLLFMAVHPEERWTAEDLAKELRSSPRSIARWLKDLKGQKLISETEDLRFIFQTESSDLQTLVLEVGDVYKQRRVSIIEMIFNKPAYRLQSFADAFKLRKDGDDG